MVLLTTSKVMSVMGPSGVVDVSGIMTATDVATLVKSRFAMVRAGDDWEMAARIVGADTDEMAMAAMSRLSDFFSNWSF